MTRSLEPRHFSALGGTRTPNLLIRSQMLYPLSYKRRVEFDSSLLENQASRGALPKPQVSDKRGVVTSESLLSICYHGAFADSEGIRQTRSPLVGEAAVRLPLTNETLRSREDLNLRRTLDPYLISSEAHSTGLCDDS